MLPPPFASRQVHLCTSSLNLGRLVIRHEAVFSWAVANGLAVRGDLKRANYSAAIGMLSSPS